MIRGSLWVFAMLFTLSFLTAFAQSSAVPIEQRQWFETRSAHFNFYSCAAVPDVYALATHLEQFCEAYTLLAGADAVASPPIIVIAFPDRESMRPFLPRYQDRPANIAGFFKRGSDANLIVLSLPATNSAFSEMQIIFHEYAHLLFRRNSRIWPLWLSEGMAEVYSTFESSGYTVRIAKPIESHLALLSRRPLMPLHELFAVNHDSPSYNERDRQGVFYAESWLLTHYLMAGGVVAYRARFEQFTRLLREGQLPEQAFTNALQTSLPAVEMQLRLYLESGRLEPIQWMLSKNLSSAKAMTARMLTPVEIYFRLGNELLALERFDAAESYFSRAQKLAPASPLPYEGQGLLAGEQEKYEDAVRFLKQALQKGSTSFVAHYAYARENFQLTGDSKGTYHRIGKDKAAEIRGELDKAIAIMPSFGPAHELRGFLEMLQGDDLALAEQHLQRAVQLEPDNPSFSLSLAQAQLQEDKTSEARLTLRPLLLPQAEPKVRELAREIMKKIEDHEPAKP